MSSKSKAAKKAGRFAIEHADEIISAAEGLHSLHQEMRSEEEKASNVQSHSKREQILGHLEKLDKEALSEEETAENELDEVLDSFSTLIDAIAQESQIIDDDIRNLENLLQKVSGGRLNDEQAEQVGTLVEDTFQHLASEVELEEIATNSMKKVLDATGLLGKVENEQIEVERNEENLEKRTAEEGDDRRIEELMNEEKPDENELSQLISHLEKDEAIEEEELEELEAEKKHTIEELEEFRNLLEELIGKYEAHAGRTDLIELMERVRNSLTDEIAKMKEINGELNAEESELGQIKEAAP